MPSININIDDATHHALRIRALEQGLSMQTLVLRAVLKRLGTPEPPLTAEQALERRTRERQLRSAKTKQAKTKQAQRPI